MFKWRLVNREDYYPTLQTWWDLWEFPHIPITSLPTRIFVVYSGFVDLYAIPVYISDADFCWIGFITSNKDIPRDTTKRGALEYLVDKIETVMKYEGVNTILTTSDTPQLMKFFKSMDFKESDKETNYYTKQL